MSKFLYYIHGDVREQSVEEYAKRRDHSYFLVCKECRENWCLRAYSLVQARIIPVDHSVLCASSEICKACA